VNSQVPPAKPGADETSTLGGVKDYIGIEKLSVIIGRTYPTTLKMVHQDKIKGTQHGAEWRIKLTEVRRFLEQGNNPNPQPHK
jgi:excisionase family DNA binding protein